MVVESRADRIDSVIASFEFTGHERPTPGAPRSHQAFPRVRREDSLKSWRRIAPTVLVLALVGSALGALSAAGYCVGQDIDSDLRFFEPRRVPTFDEAAISFPIEYALRTNETNDVIFVGDSTCRCGIDPITFERLSGLRAYNLGTQGRLGPLGLLITAKAYLARHPPPRILVLCLAPNAFENGPAETAAAMGSTLEARFEANYGPEVPGLVPREESARYFIKRGSLAAWSASSRLFAGCERDIRDLPLFGTGSETYRMFQRRIDISRGYDPLVGLHGKRIELEWPGEPVKIQVEWDRIVRLLAQSCETIGIPLLIRFSPMPSDLSHVKDFSPIEQWSKELHRSCRQARVGQPNLLWYDWTLCYDNLHLNPQGVAIYTPQLVKDVRDALRIAAAPDTK